MEAIKYKDIVLKGEVAARGIKNFARLHDRLYMPGVVGTSEAENVGWPGDWEGRTILALTLMGQSLKSEPAYLKEIISAILSELNTEGYRGDLTDLSSINEQQLAGHGWLLRGLVEYYLWKGDEKIKTAIIRIINGLYLPLTGRFSNYPAQPEDRGRYEGKAAGDLTGETIGGWRISSDTGCAFIALDGLTHVYELLHYPALGVLIDEMIDTFLKIDFTGITMQTHATLTATRGVMRMYTITHRPILLGAVRRIFELYKLEGMTENFANYNWFCKPEWTEPCGIIDSFMLAMSLWEHTGESAFLDDAHNIWYNGIGRGQRPNGGFGCDKCVTDGLVGVYNNYYEAYWCCTMRGGEGLSSVSCYSLYKDNDTLILPFYLDGIITLGNSLNIVLRETSHYPVEGLVQLEVLEGAGKSITLEMYLPLWAQKTNVTKNGSRLLFEERKGFVVFDVSLKAGDVIELCFDIPVYSSGTVGKLHAGKGLKTVRHGALILGAEIGAVSSLVNIAELVYKGNGRYEGNGVKLFPLNNVYLMDEKAVRENIYRILFNVK
jgi:Uncharacterized protein conserved in bacteria